MIVLPTRTRGGRMSLLVTALAATSALTLAACGSSATTASGGSKPNGNPNSGTIVWWASPITTTQPDPRTVLINEFEKVHTNIKVHLQSAPNNPDTHPASLLAPTSRSSPGPAAVRHH